MTGPFVIAEAGVNHNGELDIALKLVDAAAEAGADAVKFQAFRASGLTASGTRTAAYQRTTTGQIEQAALLRGLELGLAQFGAIAEHCRARGIEFMCTPFEASWAAPLVAMGMKRIKVASGELTNAPALRHFATFGLPILLSTGMSTLDEVGEALQVLRGAGAKDVVLLQCTSLYPCPPEWLNLRAIETLRESFGIPVGYSDHSRGLHAAVAATALGATVIEKHLTLDRAMQGPDHAASLEPAELGELVRQVRETALALGDGRKQPGPPELETAVIVRRSWHAARDLEIGHVLSASDLVLKRPADGLPPSAELVGRVLRRAVRRDAPIRADDLALVARVG